MVSRTLLSCRVSLVGPLLVEPNHSMFQHATSSVVAVPLPGTVTASARCLRSPPSPSHGTPSPHDDATIANNSSPLRVTALDMGTPLRRARAVHPGSTAPH